MSVQGYVRQSSGVIINGHVINASDSNNEYNALASFADASSGHNHDGTTGAGQQIPPAGLVSLNAGSTGLIRASGSNTFSASTLVTADIANSAVTYAKIQNETNNTLLGNSSGGAAAPSEQTIGATLAFTASQLRTVAMTGDVTSSANSFATTVAKIQGTVVSGTTGSGSVVFATSPTITGATLTTATVTGTITSSAVTITGGSITGVALRATSGTLGSTDISPTTNDVNIVPTLGSVNIAGGGNTNITPAGDVDIDPIGNVNMQPGGNVVIQPTGTVNITSGSGSGILENIAIGQSSPQAGSFRTLIAGANLANNITLTGAASTFQPTILFTGSDANVSGILDTKGNSSNLNLRINGATSLSISGGSTIINSVNIAGGASGVNPAISFQGAATVGGLIYTAGTGNIDVKHDNTTSFCARFLRVSGATNALTFAGSTTTPIISTTAGDLTLNSATGNVLSNTPTALDNSTKVATTAFIKTNGTNASKLTALGVNTVLTTADLGSVVDLTANTVTLTLPAVASCPAGSMIIFVTDAGVTTGSWTMKGNAAENIVRSGAAGTNTVSINFPMSVIAISTNSKWIVYG